MLKSHIILIEIQKGAHNLKKEQPKAAEDKNTKIQTGQMYMAFGPLTSSFFIELDFKFWFSQLKNQLSTHVFNIKLSTKFVIHNNGLFLSKSTYFLCRDYVLL